MINFEEELKKFHPSLEVEDAEEAIYNQDLTDAADLLVKMMKEAEEKEEKKGGKACFVITAAAICQSMISVHPVEQMYPSIKRSCACPTVFTTTDWRKREYGILRVRSTAYGRV